MSDCQTVLTSYRSSYTDNEV